MGSKRKIILICNRCLVIVSALAIITYFAVARFSKTTQDYLNEFEKSLSINREILKQKIVNKIEIFDGDNVAANYSKICQIDLSGQNPLASLNIDEIYSGTEIFNIKDEFYLKDNLIYVKRTTSSEIVQKNYPADIDIFWEVVTENIGAIYEFKKEYFEDLNLKVKRKENTLETKIKVDLLESFFAGRLNVANINNVSLKMSINKKCELKTFELKYQSLLDSKTQDVVITIKTESLEFITFPNWIVNE